MGTINGKEKKKLRKGFTTGTCAAAAAAAAVREALGFCVSAVDIVTPGGTRLRIPTRHVTDPGELAQAGFERSDGADEPAAAGLGRPGGEAAPGMGPGTTARSAVCAVQKDSGDDPDVTDGVMVYARAALTEVPGGTVEIAGGKGIGVVTKPGLACPVGQAAINPTPRRMIEEEARRFAAEAGYEGGISVEIAIPAGVKLAEKTYNPRLGIEGGISVLGTSGIVEPMSEQALIDTIRVEMNIRKAAGARYILLTPGNYGETFLKEHTDLKEVYTVKCSNFLGEALDYAEELGFEGLLLVAHIGKLVKVAGGIMNTHSKYGDARLEILAAHAARLGASAETVGRIMDCVTTDDAIAVLDGAEGGPEGSELRRRTIASILGKIDYHIGQRTHHALQTGAVMFSNQYGYLGQTAQAGCLIRKLEVGE